MNRSHDYGGQGDLVRVSAPYRVALSTDQYDLNSSATIHMHYHADAVAGILTHTLRIHRWDEVAEQWGLIGGTMDEMHQMVSVQVDHLSTFACWARRSAAAGSICHWFCGATDVSEPRDIY